MLRFVEVYGHYALLLIYNKTIFFGLGNFYHDNRKNIVFEKRR
jgi:hypothetical protein